MIRLADPWFLLLLVPLVGVWAWRWRHHGPPLPVQIASLDGCTDLPRSWAVRLQPYLLWIKAVALCLMILALARPQSGEHKITTPSKGVNIILALDLSESMKALDFKQDGRMVTRLDAVKQVVSDFILKRDGDRIGLVVFGSHAFTQLPLTRDYHTIAFMLDHLEIGAAGPRTAIGDALGISLKRLGDIPSRSNLVILLTDGKSNSGGLSWQDAAEIAAQRGVTVHTIGVGTTGKVPFLVDGVFGKQYVYQTVEVDFAALETIANTTGGRFFKAADTDSLSRIYGLIDEMEKTEEATPRWVTHREWYGALLAAGLCLYLVQLLLSQTRCLEVP